MAIKVLSPTFAGHNDAMQRFLREATAAAATEHPNVLPIHAIVTESAELPFLVMRYVDGPSVEKLIADQNGPLEFEQVLAIAKAVSSALEAAHAKDLTHRDIKPSNILLEREKLDHSSESPTIYLTDFGLARIANDTSLTRPGTFLGTPQFSSPEQARGDHADHRSDLFSLGTVLYTMATGASPFSGEDNSLTSVIYRVAHEPHPPTLGVNPSLPGWFAELVDRLLEKESPKRPASAELVTRCLDEESVAPLSDRAPSLRNRPRILLIPLVLIGLLFGTLLILKNRSDPEPPEADAHSSQGPGGALMTDQGVTMITGATRQDFPTLAQALEAVEDESILEIAQDGKIETDPLTTPPGISLTIRAAPGYRPVLVPPRPNVTLLTIRGPLVLEGLTLHGDNDNDLTAPPLVRVEAESFFAIGCRFELPTNVRPKRRSITFLPPSSK